MKKITILSIYLFAICFCAVLLTSCEAEDSEDVNQDRIFTEYELFYDKAAGKTYAFAFFKFGNRLGTPLQLTAPSEIRFNGEAMAYVRNPVASFYKIEIASPVANPVLTGTFTFKNTDGKTYTNIVNVARAIENPDITAIKKSNGAFTYTWTGAPVASNENVGLTIVREASGFDTPRDFDQDNVGATSIIVTLNRVNQLQLGPTYLTVDREIEVVTPNAPSAGGVVRGRYQASKTITIEP